MKGIEDAKRLIRQPYVWPGGYPLFAVMTDGGCLCHKCAKAEFRTIVSSHLTDARRRVEEQWDYILACGGMARSKSALEYYLKM